VDRGDKDIIDVAVGAVGAFFYGTEEVMFISICLPKH
jgi:hypothetical protein